MISLTILWIAASGQRSALSDGRCGRNRLMLDRQFAFRNTGPGRPIGGDEEGRSLTKPCRGIFLWRPLPWTAKGAIITYLSQKKEAPMIPGDTEPSQLPGDGNAP